MKVDVAIIGGSLAGAACARELTRLGVDALAMERDVFPREKVCGGFLSPNAVDRLDELGLLNRVREAGAVTVDHARITTDGVLFQIPFERPGLGISRRTLDHIVASGAPVQQGMAVRHVHGSHVETDQGGIDARMVIDAAGKLSRFTRHRTVPEFGIQFTEEASRGSSLDFWFFRDGYGGGVTIEGSRSNFCFLIRRDALDRYLSKPGRRVTGPLSYERLRGDILAIGDAAGMIDPFCGEGIHHALDTGMLAARVVARGLREKRSEAEMRQAYEMEWSRRWASKRMLTRLMRPGVGKPKAVRFGLNFQPAWLLRLLWAKGLP
jgi:flavin-dependent dehydrogenase